LTITDGATAEFTGIPSYVIFESESLELLLVLFEVDEDVFWFVLLELLVPE
jgi:hypothetical protein